MGLYPSESLVVADTTNGFACEITDVDDAGRVRLRYTDQDGFRARLVAQVEAWYPVTDALLSGENPRCVPMSPAAAAFLEAARERAADWAAACSAQMMETASSFLTPISRSAACG